MKVLFFTYYWPPSGKASLHLPLKIIKYFPKFGVEPIVVTINNDSFSQNDNSFINDISPELPVYRTKVAEPFNLYRVFTGKDKAKELIPSETISLENKSLPHRISIWIRMNLFVPDARIGWYPYGIKEGKKLIAGMSESLTIITVGPPHSTHLIGYKLSKKFKLNHIPIFIDPWVDIAYYREFKRSSLTLKLDNYFEKKVLLNSYKTIFVTEAMQEDYIKKYPEIRKKAHVLHWGYSEDEFIGFNSSDYSSSEKNQKVIVHAGNIFDYQNPREFWQEIKRRNDNGENYLIKFIGTVSPGIKSEIKKVGLIKCTEFLGFLSYKEMLSELFKADFLLVCATEKRHLPGKLFEYLRTGKPIIAFGDDNKEMESILNNANAGMVFKYNENGKVFFDSYNNFIRNIDYIRRFDRENITRLFSELIKENDNR